MNHILQIVDLVTGKRCALRIDPADTAITLAGLLDKYLKHPPVESLLSEGRITEGYAQSLQDIQDLVYISADDGLLHEMFNGIAFRQENASIGLDEVPESADATVGGTTVSVVDIAIDRLNVGYDRNWAGFHKRRWERREKEYSEFVRRTLSARYSKEETTDILSLRTSDDKLRFIRALAKRIWKSDFENYSRFVGDRLQYKTGDEALRNIMDGGGGICSEKVQALKFITDHYGIESEYVLAGADASEPVPEDKLREMLTTFDFRFAKRYMRYWQHVALLYRVDGKDVLVDVTNGNIPFLFLVGDDAKRLLGDCDKQPLTVKMSIADEDFYFHRVAQDIPESLYFAMEGWIEDVDLVQVFDNELGLYISSDFFVTAIVYKSGAAFAKLKGQYLQACEKAGVKCEVDANWSLESPLGLEFQESAPEAASKVIAVKEHLLTRYDECHGPSHQAGLVVIKLRPGNADVRDSG
ncbi:MAG: hypothetical protein J4N99_04275 [Chloroflexi bacterium]|nr:hypothetical protein [Chloroflexota bacterium]